MATAAYLSWARITLPVHTASAETVAGAEIGAAEDTPSNTVITAGVSAEIGAAEDTPSNTVITAGVSAEVESAVDAPSNGIAFDGVVAEVCSTEDAHSNELLASASIEEVSEVVSDPGAVSVRFANTAEICVVLDRPVETSAISVQSVHASIGPLGLTSRRNTQYETRPSMQRQEIRSNKQTVERRPS